MIAKIDHVSLTVGSRRTASRLLEHLGYQRQFVQRHVPNLEIKRPFLHAFSDTHDLELFTHELGIGIELIRYPKGHSEHGYLTPIFSNLPDKAMSDGRDDGPFDIVYIPSFDTFVYLWQNAETQHSPCRRFVASTPSTADSMRFWNTLGFQRNEKWQGMDVLSFSSPLQAVPCVLYLLDTPQRERFHLDDRGFNSMAVVSTSLRDDASRLQDGGYLVTDTESLTIHDRPLDICFTVGPGGELVELIGLHQ